MPTSCNIDKRGRIARTLFGLVMIALAAVLALAWARPAGGVWPWVAVVALAAFGAFSIYEGRKGWCAMRALGVKTPM